MRWIARLSGKHDELPRREILEVLGAEDGSHEVIEERYNTVIFDSEEFDFSRLAFTKEVSSLVDNFEIESEPDLDLDFDGSFAVRAVNIDGEKRDNTEIESKIGKAIEEASGSNVDLENPEKLFKAYIINGEVYLGLLEWETDPEDFESRRNHLRPFSSPVSLHPRLARALVNLAGVGSSTSILDPFLGTGGILIEAGLMGMEVHGLDIDPDMVDGAEKNLNKFGIEADLRQGEINNAEEIFEDQSFDAVVTDMPYGKASITSGEKDRLVDKLLEISDSLASGNLVFMIDERSLPGMNPEFEIYVNRSLSRYVYIPE
ncbi:MAG: THUMP domain-containing protein [Candidatus Nanohaloarchaea archaeon]|nr:THUMP domain-containing protein [Candidatus Nanohaloarchaea archaeon]